MLQLVSCTVDTVLITQVVPYPVSYLDVADQFAPMHNTHGTPMVHHAEGSKRQRECMKSRERRGVPTGGQRREKRGKSPRPSKRIVDACAEATLKETPSAPRGSQ